MAIFTPKTLKLITYFPKIFICLVLSSSVSLILCPSKKVLAIPHLVSGTKILAMGVDECKARATQAGTIAFTSEKSSESDLGFQLFGYTSLSSVVIYCIERPERTVVTITTSSDSSDEHFGNAPALYRRIWSFMETDMWK
ncbi:hypothetical protein Sta7437_1735 [Stanieria cyanosphaera PCC 7437]|uniref:Uncharacterized protein n=1 Tax=Stanieria cyanosphaera (strain ATCC 29371 / PCC 7437) TaxID=111780 RepID=K9XTA5_STAC7|nr:hypothetical protein [Stanieria cyanosphaera]AFZ35294.1 hypothetical protein Sta7437_1735 [Stanieria cyanosphaera PCC 7437]